MLNISFLIHLFQNEIRKSVARSAHPVRLFCEDNTLYGATIYKLIAWQEKEKWKWLRD
jgi:hypothetical protein